MNQDQFIAGILEKERGEQLEFVQKLDVDFYGKTICGFLNNKGGQLIIGISKEKEVIGLRNSKMVQMAVQNNLKYRIVPEPFVMVSIEEYKDKKVLLIKVGVGTKQPYIFDGSIFIRRKEKTSIAETREISALISKREQADLNWERRPVSGFDPRDLDVSEIEKAMHSAKTDSQPNHEIQSTAEFLEHYGLYQNGQYTNAAVILFAKKPARFIPQIRVRLSVLKSGKTGDVFTDDRLLDGNIFRNRQAILEFFDKHLYFVRTFESADWKRDDGYQIPMKALREGIMNALVHRDYSLPSSAMSVLIYPDRIEITNTGISPYNQSELKKNHLSMPYNPDIAHMVFLRGYIEKIGRGTIMIAEECKKAGLRVPKWDIRAGTVKLTLFFKDKDIVGGAVGGATEGAFRGAIEGAFGGAFGGALVGGTPIAGMTEGTKDKLTRLLEEIAKNEGERKPHFQDIFSWSDTTFERYIKLLKDKNLIIFKGEAAQTGGYYLTKFMEDKLK